MDLFIVYEYAEDDTQVLGVFSTEEKAETFLKLRKKRASEIYGTLATVFQRDILPITLDDTNGFV